MARLLKLALQLAGLRARAIGQAALMIGVALILLLIFLLIGLAGLAGALWIVLARATDPAIAALIIGGAGFVLAGVTLLIARVRMRPPVPPAPAVVLKDAEAAVLAFMAKSDGGGVWGPILAVALIGFLVTGRK